jgi:16S rRNA (cytidine1402-2'-O)-methyltransferase
MSAPGRLFVCATPIGNLGDVTLRVLEALRGADTVLAEDTRVTRKLFSRYEISTPLERYDEHVAARDTAAFVDRLAAGETFALVSDAGTPGISDPGSTLIDSALEAGVVVEVLPGASAVMAALVASGLPTHAFYFGGFLPRKAGERARMLDSLSSLDATLIFYESPKRTAKSLAAIAEALPGRRAVMARELTKLYEEVVRDEISELAAAIAQRESLKGEVVLLIGPPTAGEEPQADAEDVLSRVEQLVSEGVSRTDAVKRVAAQAGLSRHVVYEIAHRR